MDELKHFDTTGTSRYRISIPRCIAMVFVTLFCWWIVGSMAWQLVSLIPASHPLAVMLVETCKVFVPFVWMGFGLYISIRYIARMRVVQFTTDSPTFRYRMAFFAGLIFFAVLFISEGVLYLMDPGSYQLIFQEQWTQRLVSLPLILLLIPFQAACEELLFRCLPERVICGKIPTSWTMRLVLCTVSALLFILPHLANPDLAASNRPLAVITFYALFGFLAMGSAMLTGGFEVAIGIHAANNLFTALVCNYPDSPLPSVPLALSIGKIDTYSSCVQLLLAFGVVYLVFQLTSARNSRPCR